MSTGTIRSQPRTTDYGGQSARCARRSRAGDDPAPWEGLAQQIVTGSVPYALLHCRVVALDLYALTAHTVRGEAEGRQVPDARIAAVNGTGGWFSATGTLILGVDR